MIYNALCVVDHHILGNAYFMIGLWSDGHLLFLYITIMCGAATCSLDDANKAAAAAHCTFKPRMD